MKNAKPAWTTTGIEHVTRNVERRWENGNKDKLVFANFLQRCWREPLETKIDKKKTCMCVHVE